LIDALWLAGLLVLCMAGVALTLVRLPGPWLLVGAATVYSWHYDWAKPAWQVLIVIVVMAVIGEVLEMAASAFAAGKAGASRRAMLSALVGGVVGMFVFSVPLPIIGTILGGALGCFIGAAIGEWSTRKHVGHVARVGLFAATGQVVGAVVKIMVVLMMFATTVIALFFADWK
jgi:uncharacterized protein